MPATRMPRPKTTRNLNLNLETYDAQGALRVIVEAPRSSSLKFEFDPSLGLFTVSRELPLGLAYPFDWGFIPGTRGDDGDPLDAMVLHHEPSYPGVLLPCRLLGMVEVEQRDGDSAPQTNNRIIATPSWHEALSALQEARDLPKAVRREIEQFFVSAVAFTGKRVAIQGWASAKKAAAFIKESRT
jgi:inorganic pyrophosphatase